MSEKIDICVTTNSGRSEIGEYDKQKSAVMVYVKSLPESGKANMEVIRLFSKKYKKDVKIIKGATSRKKSLSIG